MKTLRNLALGAVLAVLGTGAALAHSQHGGCHSSGGHEQQKDGKHEHDRR